MPTRVKPGRSLYALLASVFVACVVAQVFFAGMGAKDTVDLTSGERTRVLARFEGYRGRYVFHCHNLEHEDMMMMANFEVV